MIKQALVLTLLLAVHPVFSQKKTAPAVTIDLATALAKKMITFEASGTGGYQGECLKISARSLTGKNLRLRIPLGQFLEPSDSTLQTLVVARAYTLTLSPKAPVQATLQTFCAQAGDASPRPGAGFAVGAQAPEQLLKLLQFIVEQGKTGDYTAQNAVWCVTDKLPIAGIGDPALAKFTAELLGRPVPGYRIHYETQVVRPGDRAWPGKALVVEGNYQYVLEKDAKVQMLLLDESGKLIKELSKPELMAAGEHRGNLHLEVYNLPQGRYMVRMQTVQGVVIKDTPVEF